MVFQSNQKNFLSSLRSCYFRGNLFFFFFLVDDEIHENLSFLVQSCCSKIEIQFAISAVDHSADFVTSLIEVMEI